MPLIKLSVCHPQSVSLVCVVFNNCLSCVYVCHLQPVSLVSVSDCPPQSVNQCVSPTICESVSVTINVCSRENNLDEAELGLFFSADFEVLGKIEQHDLKEGGSELPVTEKNKQEYVE